MKRLLKGGRLIDPAASLDGAFDLLIDGDRIARVGRDLPASLADGGEIVEVPAGIVICPGLIDMHVSPGRSTRKPSRRARRPRWRAASPPSPACRTPIRSTTTPV
jgi:predicted amidohydrolase